MSTRAEIVVLAVLLGLVGIIIVGFILGLGLFGAGLTRHSSGGVLTVSSCPPPPFATAASAGCNGD